MASFTSSLNSSKLKLVPVNIRGCRKKEAKMPLFLKENDIGILTLNETWLKINFKVDIPIYSITHRNRPRKQVRGAAIPRRNDINFDIIDTCSKMNTDSEAITTLLKNCQDSTSISAIYILPASTISTTLLNNIKKSQREI